MPQYKHNNELIPNREKMVSSAFYKRTLAKTNWNENNITKKPNETELIWEETLYFTTLLSLKRTE